MIPWQNLTLKGALAFFLVLVSATMVFLWMLRPPTGMDGNALALLASFVTMFIKMAADAVGYQYNSSAGSDKKDDTQAMVAGALADKVAAVPAATPAPVVVVAWWSLLDDNERALIAAAAKADDRVAAFVKTSQAGTATADDLAYLMTKGLLSRDRAGKIQST